MTLELEVQRAVEGPGLPSDASLRHWAEAALSCRRDPVELAIRLVGEEESRTLNRDFRGIDRPTNVLAFPFEVPAEVETDLLGDLAICAPVVQREAVEQGKPLTAHWAHMVVHGILHLQGYDHGDAAAAAEMEALEIEILAALGFPDPYR